MRFEKVEKTLMAPKFINKAKVDTVVKYLK